MYFIYRTSVSLDGFLQLSALLEALLRYFHAVWKNHALKSSHPAPPLPSLSCRNYRNTITIIIKHINIITVTTLFIIIIIIIIQCLKKPCGLSEQIHDEAKTLQ
jgi:hypothetical protein